MKKYRIVEFVGGGYGIQYKLSWWSRWKLLPNEPISFLNGAHMEISRLSDLDLESIKYKKRMKIKSVYRSD
jgi:hypothetical protein